MENQNQSSSSDTAKKDFVFGVVAGLLIGLLFLPILKAAKPNLFVKFWPAIVPFFFIATPLGLAIAKRIGNVAPVIWQIAKFGVIGVLNTLVDIGFLALITFAFRSGLGINSKDILLGMAGIAITYYSIYKTLSFTIANINSYFWNKYWTFKRNDEKKSHVQFIQFFIVSLVGFVVNVVSASAIFFFVSKTAAFSADQAGLIGAAAGSIASLVCNFLGYKFIVFKEPTAKNPVV